MNAYRPVCRHVGDRRKVVAGCVGKIPMLNILHQKLSLCDGLSRREWIRAGSLALGGLSWPALLQSRLQGAESNKAASRGKAKSVILLWFGGGNPHHESWDPKPEAPREIRGDFGTIATRTPGVHFGELMPQIAGLSDRIAVLRAVVTNDQAHSSSGYQMLTGVTHVPLSTENVTAKAPNLCPSGAAIMRYLQPRPGGLPSSIVLPAPFKNMGFIPWPGQDAGVLGRQYDPWVLDCDPSEPNFRVPDLSLLNDVSTLRFDRRRSLLEQVNRKLDNLVSSAGTANYSAQEQQALGLLSGAAGRAAFDLSRESATVRDRYGHTRWGQSVLLARRLVEAGVPLVQVNWTRIEDRPNFGSWDTHEVHSESLKSFLMPMMDQTFSALLMELEERNLLDSTLVVACAEFGHTPRFNAKLGRDHWGNCFSIALAGGGVQGGAVYGKSDDRAAYPVSGRVEPKDILATVFHLLGYDPETPLRDNLGRTQPLSRGRVIDEILA